jgi:hypothetical protein
MAGTRPGHDEKRVIFGYKEQSGQAGRARPLDGKLGQRPAIQRKTYCDAASHLEDEA